MKKLIPLLLALALLCACTGPAPAPAPVETPAPVTLSPETTAAPVTETAPAPETTAVPETTEEPFDEQAYERDKFYHTFWELDPDQTDAWLAQNPEYFQDGYQSVAVKQAWLGDSGLDLYTVNGHKVLAIDAKEKILILRIICNNSRGVLAIAKDPSRLHLYPSANMGVAGEHIGDIAPRHGGVLAVTGSGFLDPNGNGNGGRQAGYSMCDGVSYGERYGYGYWRIELHDNNWFYVRVAAYDVGPGTTDAMEFTPALLIDGEFQDPGIWTGENPRACIGQNDKGEILMAAVEGRFSDSPGCSVVEVARIMKDYGGLNAINVDGGTTAILWYRGKPIIRCSNTGAPEGRYLPNAWVYVGVDSQ